MRITIHNPAGLPTLPYQKLNDFQGDFKKSNEAELRKLTDSIKRHGIFVPKFVWFDGRKAYILDGHQTRAALQLLEFDGWEVPPIPYVEVKADSRKDAAEKLLLINSRYGDINPTTSFIAQHFTLEEFNHLLGSIAIPELDVDRILDGLDLPGDEDEDGVGEDGDVEPHDIVEEVAESDMVIVNFSGGKDSLLALDWARRVAAEHHKPVRALFVETGAEFPDVASHALRTCEHFGVDLRFLRPPQSILEYYWQKKTWPDSIFRDCIQTFINKPCDDYIASELPSMRVVTVRGGRSDQKASRSKTDEYQEVKLPGGGVKKLLSPFFATSTEEYQSLLDSMSRYLWPGYELGFARTACWCCPFQTEQQWDALRAHYPLLYREMGELTQRLKMKYHKGDSNYRRLQRYWGSKDVDNFNASVDEESAS